MKMRSADRWDIKAAKKQDAIHSDINTPETISMGSIYSVGFNESLEIEAYEMSLKQRDPLRKRHANIDYQKKTWNPVRGKRKRTG